MSIEERIRNILEGSAFGLDKSEISSRAGLGEKTVFVVLDRMASQRKIKRTVAGRAIFYSSLKSLAVIIIIFSLTGIVHAQKMNSTNYTMDTVLDSAGMHLQSTGYQAYGSVGQVSGLASSISYDLCSGFLCNFIEFITNPKVSFLLDFNISGNSNDVVFADNFTLLKQYRASSLTNYYSCLEDSSLPSIPTFGIIFAGTSLNYINISSGNSYAMKVSQDIPGNDFIIPITQNNCTVFNSKISQIAEFGQILQPFVLINEAVNSIELSLNYPSVDIAGSVDKTGSFSLDIEKNNTNGNQIIIKPV